MASKRAMRGRVFLANKVYDPASVLNAAMTSTTITVTGAVIGDFVQASFSLALVAGWLVSASVTAADTVTVTLYNATGGTLDLASGTLYVRVVQNL